MKFRYDFVNGHETIEVDEEWMAVLREFDRLEYNAERRQRYHCWHYDAFLFEGPEMGKEDSNLAAMFDGSPQFDYALEHLLPRHKEVLYRRAINGETYSSIAKSYGLSHGSVVYSYYLRVCARFKKFYEEWAWLHSKENTAPPGSEKITVISAGLTPAQIMVIRAYRYQYKSIKEIAKLVGVSIKRVEKCLHDNPINETKCPNCGNAVKQFGFGAMKIFCSRKCYFAWFRKNSQDANADLLTVAGKTYLTEPQKLMINFYRQLFINIDTIGKIVKVSRQHIHAFVYSYPLPYTLCKFCGSKIPGKSDGKPLKYCSAKCRERYDNRCRALRKKNGGNVRERILPTAEQLEYAILLRYDGFSFKDIRTLTGMSCLDTDELFRFYKTVELKCSYCKKTFITDEIQTLYCSDECQAKAKAKRKKRRKRKMKNAIQK